LSDKHAMPTAWGYQEIIYAVPIILLCTFIIKLSENLELWHQVINHIGMSPFMIWVTWIILIYTFFKVAIGIVMIILKDKKLDD
jgi:hypothetical protein